MRLAADTSMLKSRPLAEVFRTIAEAGYRYVELAPRQDFLPTRSPPQVTGELLEECRGAIAETDVEIASLFVVYDWASPDEATRQAAVAGWERAIETAVELGCRRINTELTGDLGDPAASEEALFRSLDHLLPRFEAESLIVAVEPHPGDFIERASDTLGLLRRIGNETLRYLHCMPHTFYLGGTLREQLEEADDLLDHVHIADTYRPERTILNPPAPEMRVHQHFDIGSGEIEWDEAFGCMERIGFDGVMTVCVFFWEERVLDSLRHNLEAVRSYLDRTS